MEKLKYYLKKIKTNAKAFYDEEAFEKINNDPSHDDYSLISFWYLVVIAIATIPPLIIISMKIGVKLVKLIVGN